MSEDLAGLLTHIMGRLSEIERKQDGRVTQGPVDSVDAKAGTVRLRIGGTDDEPFLSAPIPYFQQMGALKVHTPPSVGQQMTIIAGAGDYRQGLALPMTQSDANPSPSQLGDENVATYGPFKIKLNGSNLTVTVGGNVLDMSGGGVAITGPLKVKGDVTVEGNHDVTGGSFTHNEKDVGSKHRHGGVERGGAITDPPV